MFSVDDCEGSECDRGSCVDVINDYRCNCPEGWTGRYCDRRECYHITNNMTTSSTLTALNYFVQTMETEGFFQFEIIINVLVSPFSLVLIPMLWVYSHYKYFNSFSAGTVFIRQNLTSTGVRFRRIKTVPALKGLISIRFMFLVVFFFRLVT